MKGVHQCGESCTCPIHGTALIYWPAGDDHACQDVTCEYGQGGTGPASSFSYRCTYSRTGYADGLVYISGEDGKPVGRVLTMDEVAEIAERAMREAAQGS